MTDDNILIIKEIKKTFRNRNCIRYNINLSLKRGRFIFITGDSGVGKSTLLNIIGLLDSAEKINGHSMLGYNSINNQQYNYFEINRKSKRLLRSSEFGFLPQGGHLLNSLSVIDNLELVLLQRKHNLKSFKNESLLKDIILKVGLNIDENNVNSIWNRRNKNPLNLSGGETQRLALARAIISEPMLLLVDEPTTYMDPEIAKLCVQLLQLCIIKSNCTVIMVTHDYKRLSNYLLFNKNVIVERYHLVKSNTESITDNDYRMVDVEISDVIYD